MTVFIRLFTWDWAPPLAVQDAVAQAHKQYTALLRADVEARERYQDLMEDCLRKEREP